ncbi:hypothetical protein BDA99DRAFT_254167 [Phascolomyces articulosus]|uniref:F-box domain-containing protein n=1 Tax=Phascolomyces articulosus TaxID=60185 RepID=A0AAD5JYE5_9FUNG|nr:hypothetical protein BDA99DRAFT_254167 [Phascolomyces articulosus]
MTSICVNMSQVPNEISARLTTALNLSYQQQPLNSEKSAMTNKLQNDSCLKHALSSSTPLEQEQGQFITKGTHVDFICLLPYEIVSSILELFSTNELLEYMDVSRDWRERITSFPMLWHQVSVGHGEQDSLSKLSLVGMYIWNYTIHQGDEKVIETSLECMRSGSINNIRSLKIFWILSPFYAIA